MGIISFINSLAMPAPQWAKDYYEKRGKHFQKRADKIRGWRFSDRMKKILAEVNDLLPEAITKFLWKEIDKAHRKYGPEAAEGHIKAVLSQLKNFTVDLNF